MTTQLTASQLTVFLAATIKARRPVLIVGGPGIGKTSIIEQAAALASNRLVISHPAVSDPTDQKGMPWVSKEKGILRASFTPFGETAEVLDSTEPTVWFFDDLGQAPPAVQASCMPWFLARRNGEHVLPAHVTIMAATNRRTDRAGVSGVLEPVKSRFASIVELVATLDEWCRWAITRDDIPPELIAYLRFQSDDLYKFEPSADLVNSPSPRTWHHAGQLMQLGLPWDILSVAIAGAVGAEAATRFMAFLDMHSHLPSIDGIMLDPDSAIVPEAPNALYAVATGLAARANPQNFGRVARYAERLVEAAHGEFATLLIRDTYHRHPKVKETPAFVRMMSGELGQLVSGAAQ